MILRRIARPMLAAVFVSGGVEALRNPKPRIQAAEPVLDKTVGQIADKLPEQVPTDAETLVKLNAVAQISAGIALALNKFPRLSALVLAGSLIPTTAAGHRFWEKEDPQERAAQQIHFFKNVSLLGGLLLASSDTHGKPSVAWRAKRASKEAGFVAKSAKYNVQDAARSAKHNVQDTTRAAKYTVQDATKSAKYSVWDAANTAKNTVRDTASTAKNTAKAGAAAIVPG